MNIEPMYQTDGHAGTPSRPTAFLGRLITVLWWAAWAVFAIFIIVLLCALLAFFGVEPLKTQLFSDIAPLTVSISAFSMLIGAGAFIIILKQLRAICQTLESGDPFVPQNAQRLRTIWIAVAIAEILRLLSGVILSGLISKGQTVGNATELTLDFRFSVWFLVFAFIIFTEVFREGARLRQEQKLTV